MSALLYYVAIIVSTFIVPLADVEYISWSEIYKYVGVSIVVGHYCELNSYMTGLIIYVLLTNRRSKLRISLSIRLASEIIILLASYQSFACNACQCCRSMKLFILLISCSQASRYGFIMVCLIYLLLLAGDIELNPGPVPGECAPSPKRTCKPKDRFMADVLSNKTELLSMTFNNLTRVYGTTARTIKTWLKGLNACGSTVSPELVQWASELLTAPKDRFLADVCSSDKAELLLSMNLSDVTEVYGATERNIKLWLKGLCTFGSTVSPRLVQWASELLTSPKDRFLADVRSSDKAELLLSMNLGRLTQVYGTTERNVRSWLQVLTACESTVSPQLFEWVNDLVTLPKDRFLADILMAGDRSMLPSMNVSSMAVHYGVTRQTVRSWVNELKSGSRGESIPVQLRDWVHHMCVNPRQRFMSEKGSGVMSMSVPDLAAEYGVTESTVNTWLKAISQPATESADIPASMLDEIGTIPNQDSVVELAQSFNVTERYVRKRIADRNRANFLDSCDVDMSNEEIAAKYGIRKASVTSWKAEADRMWYSWFAQVDFGQLAAQVQQPLEPTHGKSCLYPHCICCECAVILFECDVQWVDQFSMSHPYRATTFQGISFNLCVGWGHVGTVLVQRDQRNCMMTLVTYQIAYVPLVDLVSPEGLP